MNDLKSVPSPMRRIVFAFLLLLNLSLRLGVALQPLEHVDSIAMPDDTYLSLSIARSIAEGNGPVYSGEFTNGFQPLYVYLMVPVFFLIPDDDFLPVTIALVILSVFDTLTLLLLLRLINSMTGSFLTPMLIGAAWIFNPLSIKTAVNGLETSIASFFIVAMIVLYKRTVLETAFTTNRNGLALGALFGIGVFARIDTIMLAGALGLMVLWKYRSAPPAAARHLLLIAAGMLITYGPWFLYSWINTGDLFPVSGKAIRFMELERADYAYQPVYWFRHTMTVAMESIIENNRAVLIVTGILFFPVMLLSSPLLEKLRLRGRTFTVLYFIAGTSYTIHLLLVARLFLKYGAIHPFTIFTMILGAALYIPIIRNGSVLFDNVRKHSGVLAPVFLFAVLLFIGYTTYIYGVWFFPRYFFPVNILMLIAAAVLIDTMLAKLPSVSGQWSIAVSFMTCILAVNIFLQELPLLYRPTGQPGNGYLPIGLWAKQHFRKGTVIGACQSGALGYFARQCTVINLDGVVNKKCYEALVQRKSLSYIRSSGIQYVVNWPINTGFLERCSDEPLSNGLTDKGMIDGIISWKSNWQLFEVKQPSGAGARPAL